MHRAGWLRSLLCLSVAASTVAPRVGSYGRDLERLDSRSDRTTADESLFVVNSLHHSGGHLLRDGDNVLQWTRPGRRIGLCWEATRAPSQGPSSEIGAVTHRPTPFPLRDWHPSDKSRGLGQSPRRTTTDSPSLPAILLIMGLGSLWPASLGLRSGGRERSALGIRFSLGQHVPDDRAQLSHHGHSCDGDSPSAFDAFEPLPHPSVLA